MTLTIDPRALVSSAGCRAAPADAVAHRAPAPGGRSAPRPVGGRDLVSLYARRLACNGVAPREAPAAVHRESVAPTRFGRAATAADVVPPPSAISVDEPDQPPASLLPVAQTRHGRRTLARRFAAASAGWRRRLATAVMVSAVAVAGAGGDTGAQERYRVQAGDTVDGLAGEFGVDPNAILAASFVADPPALRQGEVIVIPDPGQSPSEAAAVAAAREGTSAWVAAAYVVRPGDTIEAIGGAYGVAPQAILDLNGLDSDLLEIGQRLLIPGSGDNPSGARSDAAPAANGIPGLASGSPFPWVPTHKQEWNLSCEYASAFIATSAFGNGIPEAVFHGNIPQAVNPHDGYRGDIAGWWGNIDDYGVYPEALVPTLNDYGFAGEIAYTGGDSAFLTDHLDAGHPVIVWLALWGDTRVRMHDAGDYSLFYGEHVMTAYAYDGGGVYLSDPAKAAYRYVAWDTFLSMWSIVDGMSLAVYPQ